MLTEIKNLMWKAETDSDFLPATRQLQNGVQTKDGVHTERINNNPGSIILKAVKIMAATVRHCWKSTIGNSKKIIHIDYNNLR